MFLQIQLCYTRCRRYPRVRAPHTPRSPAPHACPANSHRLFVSDDAAPSPPQHAASLSGVVSIVDVLSIFARLARLPDVDPTAMQRHRRASSTSSASSASGGGVARAPDAYGTLPRSRSSSRTGFGTAGAHTLKKRVSMSSTSRSVSVSPGLPPTVVAGSPGSAGAGVLAGPVPSFEQLQGEAVWAARVPR